MALEAPEDLARQIVGHMVFVFLLGTFCAYMLYRSEKEAKRLLTLTRVWYPNKHIADESAELARIRRRLIVLYAVILMISLYLFQMSARMLWDRSQQEEQGVVTEETSADGHGAEATVPAATPNDEAHVHPARPQARSV